MRMTPGLMKQKLRLYLVMGSANCRLLPETVLAQAIAAGITAFQFREKGPQALRGPEKTALALRLKAMCQNHGVPFIINDDVDLALAVDADGVHIGQEDEPAEKVRRRIGGKILGVSVHDVREARAAAAAGADYLGVGPMFATNTKSDARAVRGPEAIRQIREILPVTPIVGIGGIAPGRAAPVILGGADGVAVVSAISMADAPGEAARLLLAEVHNALRCGEAGQ
jgi:thiamine-phosphate pyrophosphorylase